MSHSNLINDFIKHAIIHGETQYSGDYKRGNKSSSILFNLSSQIEKDLENRARIVDRLLEETNPGVLIWTSFVSINMNYRKKDCMLILKNLAHNQELGKQSHNAEMTLKEFREKKLY